MSFKKLYINLICGLIPWKQKRKNVRSILRDVPIEPTISNYELLQKMNHLENLLKYSRNISNADQARGNMRLVQKAATSILAHFVKIAQKHKLKFWLDSGTLIGFIRHNGGFIPWDDDVDICMLRPDYEKLQTVLEKDFKKEGFFYQIGEITRLYYKNLHVWVDIFPMDIGYQEVPLEGEAYDNFIAKLNDIKSALDFDYNKWLRHEKPVSQEYLDTCYRRRDTELVKNKCSKGFLFYGVEAQVRTRTLYSYDTVFPLKSVKFYGIDAYIPNNSDSYLFQMYGDYMNWPNKFISYHGNLADNMSYETYTACHELIKKYYPKADKNDE